MRHEVWLKELDADVGQLVQDGVAEKIVNPEQHLVLLPTKIQVAQSNPSEKICQQLR